MRLLQSDGLVLRGTWGLAEGQPYGTRPAHWARADGDSHRLTCVDLVMRLSHTAFVGRKVVVNVHEAKTHLSRLLDRAVAGDDVTIARAGTPLVRLVPVSLSVGRPLGLDAGRIQMADDFDAPLPDDVLEDFER